MPLWLVIIEWDDAEVEKDAMEEADGEDTAEEETDPWPLMLLLALGTADREDDL